MGGASLWFLPAGLRFFTFILFGWPALLLELAVVFLANLTQFISSGQPAPGLLTTQTIWLLYDWFALPFAYALVLFPARQKMRERLDLASTTHCAQFVGLAFATASLGSTVGTIHLLYSGMIDKLQWGNVAASWFTGDFIGIITLTPLLLVRVWPRLVRYFDLWPLIDSPKALSLVMGYRRGLYTALVAILSVILVFGIPRYFDLSANTPLTALLLLLPLVGVSLRYGLSGAVLAVALLDSGLVISAVLLKQQDLTQQYQMVMVAIALVGLWLGGAVESRNRLQEAYSEQLRAEVARQTQALEQSNRELATKEQHLQVVLTAAPVGVLEFDGAGYCGYINSVAGVLTDNTLEKAVGKHVLDFIHPDDRNKMELAWNSQRSSASVQTLEVLLKNNLWCTAHWINLPLSESSLDGAILVLTDSTVRRQQEDRLWTLGHHDSLTSLPNRKLFMDRCEQALSLAKRRHSGAAVLWIDLDGFKAVNDKLGHAAGDALLQQVAQRLKSRIRDSDTLARIGGDEFAAVMSEVNSKEAVLLVAKELVASLNDQFNLPQGVARISCSIGVASYPDHASTVETLMQCADMAMYNAKHLGKNQARIGGDSSPTNLHTRSTGGLT
jgi:diguanylate cyclase (GGDEF)-like protein